MEAGPACVGAFYQNIRRGPPFKADQHSRALAQEHLKTQPTQFCRYFRAAAHQREDGRLTGDSAAFR